MRVVHLYPDPRLPIEHRLGVPLGAPRGLLMAPGAPEAVLVSGDYHVDHVLPELDVLVVSPDPRMADQVERWIRPLGLRVDTITMGGDDGRVNLPTVASRVLAVGDSVTHWTGRPKPRVAYNRRALSWTSTSVPVFHLADLEWLRDNKWAKRWTQEDAVWAASVPLGDLPAPPYDWTARMVETVQDAETAVDELLTHPEWVFDTETYGRMWWPEFRAVCLAATAVGLRYAYVWGRDAVRPDDPRSTPLRRLIRDLPAAGHNVKYDALTIRCHFGEPLAQVGRDSRLLAKLAKADGPGDLEALADLVGAGGHKGAALEAVKRAARILTKVRSAAAKPVVSHWGHETYTTKTGQVRRRKVALDSRGPTRSEAVTQIQAAWTKPITADGVKTTLAELTGEPDPTEPWITAATAELDLPELEDDTAESSDTKLNGPKTWTYGLMPVDVCDAYCALDTLTTAAILDLVAPKVMAEPGLRAVWDSHVARMPAVMADIEATGQLVDMGRLAVLEAKLDQSISDADRTIAQWAPPGFNAASRDQVAALLYDQLGLPVLDSTATGQRSTDAGTLAKLRGRHPVVEALQTRAKLVKLQSNYARGMRRWVAPDGRVHSTLNIDGAESGRMSCQRPNQQTIPSRDPVWAKPIKSLFVAPKGYQIVVLDFATLELRVLAFLAGETSMVDVFRRGGDLHRETAIGLSTTIWGSPWETCGLGWSFASLLAEQGWDYWPVEPKPGDTRWPEYLAALEAARGAPVGQPARGKWAELESAQDQRRRAAKGVNFGVVYGQSAEAIADAYGVPAADAERAQEVILGSRPAVRKFIAANQRECHTTGVTRTWWAGQPARIRPVLDIGGPSRAKVGHGERVATNTKVQGTGADFCNASVVELDRVIREVGLDARINMVVHDSIEAEVADGDVAEYVWHAKRIMCGWPSNGCPMEADAEVGPSRGETRKYKG